MFRVLRPLKLRVIGDGVGANRLSEAQPTAMRTYAEARMAYPILAIEVSHYSLWQISP